MSTPSVRARAESRWGKEATDDALTGDDDARDGADVDAGEGELAGGRRDGENTVVGACERRGERNARTVGEGRRASDAMMHACVIF